MSFDTICNLIGYSGDIATLFAYFLLHANKVKSDQLSYAVYNLIGSALLLISLYCKPNSPAIAIEIAWLIISAYGIFNFFSAKKCSSLQATKNH